MKWKFYNMLVKLRRSSTNSEVSVLFYAVRNLNILSFILNKFKKNKYFFLWKDSKRVHHLKPLKLLLLFPRIYLNSVEIHYGILIQSYKIRIWKPFHHHLLSLFTRSCKSPYISYYYVVTCLHFLPFFYFQHVILHTILTFILSPLTNSKKMDLEVVSKEAQRNAWFLHCSKKWASHC